MALSILFADPGDQGRRHDPSWSKIVARNFINVNVDVD